MEKLAGIIIIQNGEGELVEVEVHNESETAWEGYPTSSWDSSYRKFPKSNYTLKEDMRRAS